MKKKKKEEKSIEIIGKEIAYLFSPASITKQQKSTITLFPNFFNRSDWSISVLVSSHSVTTMHWMVFFSRESVAIIGI